MLVHEYCIIGQSGLIMHEIMFNWACPELCFIAKLFTTNNYNVFVIRQCKFQIIDLKKVDRLTFDLL